MWVDHHWLHLIYKKLLIVSDFINWSKRLRYRMEIYRGLMDRKDCFLSIFFYTKAKFATIELSFSGRQFWSAKIGVCLHRNEFIQNGTVQIQAFYYIAQTSKPRLHYIYTFQNLTKYSQYLRRAEQKLLIDKETELFPLKRNCIYAILLWILSFFRHILFIINYYLSFINHSCQYFSSFQHIFLETIFKSWINDVL